MALKPALGGMMLGVIAFLAPQVMDGGYGWIQAALEGKIVWGTMLLLALLKIVATSCTISSGGSGGVFGPSVFMGAMLGGAFGFLGHQLAPGWVIHPNAFVLVGIGGFFAGVAKVPVSSIIMACEMCASYVLLVPLMLVSTISYLLLGKVSLYEKQVVTRLASPAHMTEFARGLLEEMYVKEVVKPQPVVAMMTGKAHTVPAGKALRQNSASPSAAGGLPREDSRQNGIWPAGRKISYGTAIIALTVAVGLAGYWYLNGNFPATFTGAETTAGPARSDGQQADPSSLPVEISRLQAELLTAIEQKNLAGALLNTVAKEKAALAESAQELKSVRDRATMLEAEVLEQNKKLSELEHKLTKQEKILVLEKAEKDRLGIELSSRQEALAALQTRQETAMSSRHKLETELENSRRDNARLQSQLQEMLAQNQAPTPVPAVANGQPVAVRPNPAPDPAGVIEFVIKKKSQ